MRLSALFVLLPLLFSTNGARADSHVRLRMASVAPAGTTWAREMLAFSRDVAAETHGRVEVKWYLGGIAGDEREALSRIRRGQLDGEAAAQLCHQLAPSLRVTVIAGPFQSHEENRYALTRLRPIVDEELAQSGFIALGWTSLGGNMFFTRRPVRSLADLRSQRIWVWDLDTVSNLMMTTLGLKVVSLPITDAARAYDEGRIDGFLGTPTAALAYQWSARARYFVDLRAGYVSGCLLLAKRAFDALSFDEQQVVRAASAKLAVRFEDAGHVADAQLLGGLFEKHGLAKLTVSPGFRTEFYQAARRAREKLGDRLVPKALLAQVLGWLSDYRAEHPVGNAP